LRKELGSVMADGVVLVDIGTGVAVIENAVVFSTLA
jgi:hypothetical protein